MEKNEINYNTALSIENMDDLFNISSMLSEYIENNDGFRYNNNEGGFWAYNGKALLKNNDITDFQKYLNNFLVDVCVEGSGEINQADFNRIMDNWI